MKTCNIKNNHEMVDDLQNLLKDEGNYERIVTFIDENPERFHMIGVYDDEIKGILVYEKEPFRMVVHIVDQEERCKGYGTALLDHFLLLAEETGAARVITGIPSKASSFYAHYGFEPVGKEVETDEDSYLTMEYLLGRRMLSKTVKVIVDHPLGDFHPHLGDVQYPINCGYILTEKDQELINAYVIGPEEPVDSFTGVVTAVIYHKNENIMKVVVSTLGASIDHEMIIDCIGFEEQYYDTRIIWADAKHEA